MLESGVGTAASAQLSQHSRPAMGLPALRAALFKDDIAAARPVYVTFSSSCRRGPGSALRSMKKNWHSTAATTAIESAATNKHRDATYYPMT